MLNSDNRHYNCCGHGYYHYHAEFTEHLLMSWQYVTYKIIWDYNMNPHVDHFTFLNYNAHYIKEESESKEVKYLILE